MSDAWRDRAKLAVFLLLTMLGPMFLIRAWKINTGQFELTRWTHNTLSPLDALVAGLIIGYVFFGVRWADRKFSGARKVAAYVFVMASTLAAAVILVNIPKF